MENSFMTLPIAVIEALETDELLLVKGGGHEVVQTKPANNGGGKCTGVNNGGGSCGGTNNENGTCDGINNKDGSCAEINNGDGSCGES